MRIKVLPPNPSLDHLKRQAKELLAALRETDPAATLADAQRTIAQEHDFRTWPELKAEVERRRAAATAETADTSLADGIAAAFGLGRPTRPATVVAHDFQGPLLRLTTAEGDWAAHEVFSWVDHDQVERTLPLMDAARAAGVAAPFPRRAADGRWVVEVDGRSWRVDRWTDRGPALAKPAPTSAVRQVGELLGTLHALRVDPGTAPVTPWLTQRRTPDDWEQILRMVERVGAPWAPMLADALPAIALISTTATGAPPAPLVLSHTDLGWDTVRLGARRSLLVVDWDFCGPTPPLWELAGTLHTWCTAHDATVDLRRAAALRAGYEAVSGTPAAIDIDAFGSTISAWSNQLVSRMTAALRSPDAADRRRATKEVLAILTHPLTPTHLHQLAAGPTGLARRRGGER